MLEVKDLTVKASCLFTDECQVSLDGKMTVDGAIIISGGGADGYDLWTNGKTYIGGNCVIGTNGSEGDYNLTVYGNSKLDGKVNLIGQLQVNGTDTIGYNEDTVIEIDTPWSLAIGKLTFRNGVLMKVENASTSGGSSASYVLNNTDHKRGGTAGKLCYLDTVEISKASFKLGGSTISITSSSISGDTATYTGTISTYEAGNSYTLIGSGDYYYPRVWNSSTHSYEPGTSTVYRYTAGSTVTAAKSVSKTFEATVTVTAK